MDLQQKIEILGVDLLDRHRPLVEELKQLATGLGLDLGWHYLLDLSWIISHLQPALGMQVMDAGAGIGLMQWYLAGKGVNVFSVDRSERGDLPLRLRAHFRVKGLREQDLHPAATVLTNHISSADSFIDKGKGVVRDSGWTLAGGFTKKPLGQVMIYNQSLDTLTDIRDSTMDAVVAVSSLEHNPPESLPQVICELMRVLKPGGALLATLGAARDEDWFHNPSQGWCYTAASLRRLFDLPQSTPSNEDQYDQLFEALKDCRELRDNLAGFYFRSGNNGMPWGEWNPQYQSVGVCKVK